RADTIAGDSGSPIVTMEGLVAGLVTDGAETKGSNRYSVMKVLPLACVKDMILSIVSNDETNRILEILRNGSESALVNAFKPPPNATTEWVSNLHLAKAISQWGTLDKSQRNPGRDRLETVSAIIGHRLLGYSMVVDFQNSVSASAQDSGNLLKSL